MIIAIENGKQINHSRRLSTPVVSHVFSSVPLLLLDLASSSLAPSWLDRTLSVLSFAWVPSVQYQLRSILRQLRSTSPVSCHRQLYFLDCSCHCWGYYSPWHLDRMAGMSGMENSWKCEARPTMVMMALAAVALASLESYLVVLEWLFEILFRCLNYPHRLHPPTNLQAPLSSISLMPPHSEKCGACPTTNAVLWQTLEPWPRCSLGQVKCPTVLHIISPVAATGKNMCCRSGMLTIPEIRTRPGISYTTIVSKVCIRIQDEICAHVQQRVKEHTSK